MTDTVGKFVQEPAWQRILDSLLPGGDNWATEVEVGYDCLTTCPQACSNGYGPRNLCTTDWRKAEAIPLVMDTLFHVVNNFDHYNVRDLRSLDQNSLGIRNLTEFIKKRIVDSTSDIIEGGLNQRMHRYRERDSEAARQFKQRAFEQGATRCTGCNQDYVALFGSVARALYECHHTIPLAHDDHKGRTRNEDLVLLCANCHRLVHSPEIGLDLSRLPRLSAQRGSRPR